MPPGVLPLSAFDLAVASLLVVVAGLVSLGLRLGLEGRLAWAALRTVVQLLLIGYVLKWVFNLNDPLLLGLVVLVMLGAAARAAVGRPAKTFSGLGWRAVLVLAATGLLTTYAVTGVIIDVRPWWRPQYMIPLLGMILGNSLNGISLCLDELLERLTERRAAVEMELALGATRWEAARTPLREAVRRGMIPILNAMMVVGIVALPGMMTGQILAGADPLEAVKYQIVVMFMLAAATALGCVGVALLVYLRLFNVRHQLDTSIVRARRR
jgi:putative ABC transport system permease protein